MYHIYWIVYKLITQLVPWKGYFGLFCLIIAWDFIFRLCFNVYFLGNHFYWCILIGYYRCNRVWSCLSHPCDTLLSFKHLLLQVGVLTNHVLSEIFQTFHISSQCYPSYFRIGTFFPPQQYEHRNIRFCLDPPILSDVPWSLRYWYYPALDTRIKYHKLQQILVVLVKMVWCSLCHSDT